MGIGVWSYLTEYDNERDDILDAVDTVFRSGQLVLGRSVARFEKAYAQRHAVDHCVSVDNGTNAIVLGLRALGVGPGDEVVTVSNTAAPTVVAIDQVGASPVFVDIDPGTYLMDTDQLRSVVTERTACLLPVHLYGQCVAMGPVNEVAAEFGIPVLEDCAQSHGASQGGVVAGASGDLAAFSFYPTKVLGAYGDGGAVITSRDDLAENVRRLRYYGMEKDYRVIETPGHNARLDEVQAEILFRKLGRLDDYIARRQDIARRYEEGLAGTDLVLPRPASGNTHVYYLYVVRHLERDRLLRQASERGLDLNVSYRWPVHTMPGFEDLGYRPGSLPVTEEMAGQIFSLPMYPTLTETDQERVIEVLRAIV
ncbi:DegT/DnrJ/EryC1/StrS family aminotransferase [Aeromicrobium sp. CF3.5]|uniref:DegT/DnrJ/EryC1/StrS family aminotransferase n=1 Tax=Aeromicrobium sp. CF3.5 TaxID=3373078 RepID=UPI003EE78E50